MKNHILICFLIIITLNACKKDPQKSFVKEISGSYNIASITLSKADLVTDSITFTNAGEFVFEYCKIQKTQESYGSCPGYYQYNDEPKVNFRFHLATDIEPEGLRIQPNNTIIINGLNLLSVYTFQERAENKLVLYTNSATRNQHTRIAVKLTLEKK